MYKKKNTFFTHIQTVISNLSVIDVAGLAFPQSDTKITVQASDMKISLLNARCPQMTSVTNRDDRSSVAINENRKQSHCI